MAPPAKATRRSQPPVDALAHAVTRELVEGQLAQAEQLLPAVLDGAEGGEPLHDFRVSLRRARSLAQLLGDVFEARPRRDLTAQLRALAAPTGELRDLDVHLEARDPQIDALPPRLRPAGQRVFDELSRARADAHAQLRRDLEDAAYRERLTSLRARLRQPDAWPEGPLAGETIRGVAAAVIADRHSAVCKRARNLTPHTPESEVHRLRIACKKLRYAVEFFAPVLGAPSALGRLTRRLKRAQNQLGRFNDCTMQRDRLLGHEWASQDVERVLAAGALAGQLHTDLAVMRPALQQAVAKLCEQSLARRVVGLS